MLLILSSSLYISSSCVVVKVVRRGGANGFRPRSFHSRKSSFSSAGVNCSDTARADFVDRPRLEEIPVRLNNMYKIDKSKNVSTNK